MCLVSTPVVVMQTSALVVPLPPANFLAAVVVPIVLRNLLPWLPKIWIEQMRTMMPIVTLSLHCCSW